VILHSCGGILTSNLIELEEGIAKAGLKTIP